LGSAQTFNHTLTDNITSFKVINVPSGSSSFVIKFTQDITGGRLVGIDTFVDQDSTSVPVYWPSGVAPIVTGLASKTDIYSFKIMDGEGLSGSGLFGVVTGQNFG